MALTEAFKEAVKSGNIRRVRIMMKNSLLVDPSFKEFDEMENKAESMKGLYDVHDGKDFEKDKAKWNDNYMNEQMVKLISNFSRERIEHVKKVVRYLRPVSCKEQKREEKMNDKVIACAAAGAIIGGIAASIAVAIGTVESTIAVGGIIVSTIGITIAGGALVGAAVGGVVVTIVSNGGN